MNARRVLDPLRAGRHFLRRAPSALRAQALTLPGIGPHLHRRYSLAALAAQKGAAVEAARRAQFAVWHSEDLTPRVNWYAAQGVSVWGADFFRAHGPEQGRQALGRAMESLPPGGCLIVYAPHSFAFHAGSLVEGSFAWVPHWRSLYAQARDCGLRVVDFNPGFDRNGFFHFVAERPAALPAPLPPLTGRGHYFYLNVGDSPALGRSAAALSALGLRALKHCAVSASEHSFYARVPEDVPVQAGDIALGHYGLWITGARQANAVTILYGPGDRFRPTRDDQPFFLDIQRCGTFAAQYAAASMVIMQAGGRWRMSDPYPYSGLCRWMDLPVSPAVFPRTKKKIAPPGKRVFCFIGLYDDYQKGLDIARALCRRCPDFQFIAVGCKPLGEPNCREYPAVDNRYARFRRIVAQADFLVSPARDDAQPGTVAECGSLGLLPIISETTGYVLSFPRRLDVDDLDGCEATLRDAQAASAEETAGWQTLNANYLEEFHRPAGAEALLRFYLAEAKRNGEDD